MSIQIQRNGTWQKVSKQELLELVARGVIRPDTEVVVNDKKIVAARLKGIVFPGNVAVPPTSVASQTARVVPVPQSAPKQLYCTNCSNAVSEQAVVCMACGAKPTGYKKFCRQCGVALNPEQVVCVKCGATVAGSSAMGGDWMAKLTSAFQTIVAAPQPVEPEPFTAPSPGVTAQAETGQFGRVLASGNAKESSIASTTWAKSLPITVSTFVLLCVILPIMVLQEGREATSGLIPVVAARASGETSSKAGGLFFWGVISSVGLTLYTVFHVQGLVKTEITVYENGITGIGCGKYFDVNFDLHSFQLTYDKITVDTTKSAIIVHASGAQYKCYVANPAEIHRVIVNQQQRLST
ncbi:MAG: zinc ribbon domain-containing protein [Thermoguttaceae bacterium]